MDSFVRREPWRTIPSGMGSWKKSTGPESWSDGRRHPTWGRHELPLGHGHLLGPYAASGETGTPIHSVHRPVSDRQRYPGGTVCRSVQALADESTLGLDCRPVARGPGG